MSDPAISSCPTVPSKAASQPDATGHRVLLVAPQPFYQDRGTPIAVRHVVTALSEEGWHVDILTYPSGEDIDLPNVRLFRFAKWLPVRDIPIGLSLKKLALDLVMIVAIWRRIRAEDYACIHAVEEAIYPALLIARSKRLPVIYDMQSSLAEQLGLSWARFFIPNRIAVWWERKACENALLVVCSAGLALPITENASSAHVREWIFPTDTMPSAVDSSSVTDQLLNLADSARQVIYTGNFESYQGIDMLLAALPLVVAQCPDVVFLLVGADSSSLRRLSRQHIEDIRQGHLILLARQSRALTLKLLQRADVAVSPRVTGTNLPLKVFDYLVAGLPVVATQIAAHRPLAEKGLLLTEANHEGIARGILDLLREPLLMERYKARARETAKNELTWPIFRTQVATIYRDVLEHKRAQAG